MFSLHEMLEKLHVTQLDKYLFQGAPLDFGLKHIYGGQVLGQALNAAARCVDSQRRPHSMHAYFLRPGDLSRDIIFEVDPIRDGRTFSTRRVVAKQNGEAIFNASISFQIPEKGLEHQRDIDPNIPAPDTLPTDIARAEQAADRIPGLNLNKIRTFFLIPSTDIVEIRSHFDLLLNQKEPAAAKQGFWFRFNKDIGTDQLIHQTLLAFISDRSLMTTAFRPHNLKFNTAVQGASLDHVIYFHGDLELAGWHYYDLESPRAVGARGLNMGRFYDHSGILVASTIQEGLMRLKSPKTDTKACRPDGGTGSGA